ncbi:hypothetical protein [Devriesea agamarum]|uniref:hypothetical protein n=1 Tax=Devriesea agamarum TaxID=472569 RepID=UPI00155E5697|nr:hypothetical protein [Devriesea agamarum]
MLYGYLSLAMGCILIGGSWSFFRQKKPWWSIAVLLVLGLITAGAGLWRIVTEPV